MINRDPKHRISGFLKLCRLEVTSFGPITISNQPALVLGFLQDIYSHMPQEAKWGMACKLYAVIFFGMNQLAIRGIIDAIDCVREKPDACGGEIDVDDPVAAGSGEEAKEGCGEEVAEADRDGNQRLRHDH